MSDRTNIAAVKARLAALGAQLEPDPQLILRRRPAADDAISVILLDRVIDTVGTPDYCVHGFIECLNCLQLCFLGSESVKEVVRPDVFGLCLDCAPRVIPPTFNPHCEGTPMTCHDPIDGVDRIG